MLLAQYIHIDQQFLKLLFIQETKVIFIVCKNSERLFVDTIVKKEKKFRDLNSTFIYTIKCSLRGQGNPKI